MSEPKPSADRSAEIDCILLDYYRRLDAGEQVDVDQLIAEHPEHADSLAKLLAADAELKRDLPEIEDGASPHDTPTLLVDRIATAEEPPQVLRYFGDYELLEEVARGGMGVVYKARQSSLKRTVAVKMILAGELANEHDVTRFRAEAEAAARLQHPNIVQIHEVGEQDGLQFFSMEFVEGRNLAELVREKPLPGLQAAEIVHKICEAIEYAHQQGVLHRDLKPSNVLLDAHTKVRVTDFGLAKQLKSDQQLTTTGQILGTPSFMPPEQATGNQALLGPASDVYSLGAILYHLVTGRPPFAAATPVETIDQVLNKDPISPRLFEPRLPKDLETICLKCLEKEPHRRYLRVRDLADDLQRFLEHRPITARPVSRLERAQRWVQRNRIVSGLLTAIILVALIGSAAYYVQRMATDEALGKFAEEQDAKNKTSLRAAVTRVQAIGGELSHLKTTEGPNRRERALQLIREAVNVRESALAGRESLASESQTFWDNQEAMLRTDALYWLSNSSLDWLLSLPLDANKYADRQQGSNNSWSNWIAADRSGLQLAIPRSVRESRPPKWVIELFDLTSGGRISEFALDGKTCVFPRPEAITFSADGELLHVVAFSQSTSRKRVVQTYALPAGQLVSSGEVSTESPSFSRQIRFDEDGRRVLIREGMNTVLWDLSQQRAVDAALLDSPLEFTNPSALLGFAGDGTISMLIGRRLVTRNILTSNIVSEVQIPSFYRAPIRSADGRWLVDIKNPEGYSDRQGVTLGILDAESGREQSKLVGITNDVQIRNFNGVREYRDPPLLAVSPDRPYAAVLTSNELITCGLPFANVIARRKLGSSDPNKELIGVTFLGSDRMLTVVKSANRYRIEKWELSVSEQTPSKTLQIHHEPLDLAVSKQGSLLATVGSDSAVRRYAADGMPKREHLPPMSFVGQLSPSGTSVIQQTYEREETLLRVWNLRTRESRLIESGRTITYPTDQLASLRERRSRLRTRILLAVPDPDGPGSQILDADDQTPVCTLASPIWSEVQRMEVHPSEEFLLVYWKPAADERTHGRSALIRRNSLTVFRLEDGAEVLSVPELDDDALSHPENSTIVIMTSAGVTAYELSTGEQVARLDVGGKPRLPPNGLFVRSASLSPSGQHLLLFAQKGSNTVPLLWNIPENSAVDLKSSWTDAHSTKLTWNASGTRLLLKGRKPGASGVTVEFWDTIESKKLATTAGRGQARSETKINRNANAVLVEFTPKEGGPAAELWSLESGETLRQYPHRVNATSRHGTYFVAWPEDPSLDDPTWPVYDIASGRQVLEVSDYPLEFSADDRLLACVESADSPRSELILWNISTGQRIPLEVEASVSHARSRSIAFDPQGRFFASFDDRQVAIKAWDAATGELQHTVPLLPYDVVSPKPALRGSLLFSRDGTHLMAYVNGRTHCIDVEAGNVVLTLPRGGHVHYTSDGGTTNSVAISPDETLVATAGSDATVIFWDADTGEYAGSLEGFEGAVTSVRFHPIENQVMTHDANGTLTLWGLDIDADHPTDRVQPHVIWNRQGSAPVDQESSPSEGRSAQLAVSSDPSPKIAVPLASGGIEILDVATGTPTITVAGMGNIADLAFHRRKPLLAIAYASKVVQLIDYDSGRTVHDWEVAEVPLNGVTFSNDGQHVVTVGRDVAFWNISTGKQDFQHELPSTALTSVVVNPATGEVVVTAADQTLSFWNPYAIRQQLEALGLSWN